MQKQGYKPSTIKAYIQTLKSIARKTTLLNPDSAASLPCLSQAQRILKSTVGVMKRVNQLKEKRVIKHFTVRVDYEKLGLTTPIIILIRLRPKPIKEFVKDIQCPELQDRRILSIFTIAHQYNLALFGIWESKEEYGKWKTHLLTRLDSILETNELFILDSWKMPDDAAISIPSHIQEDDSYASKEVPKSKVR